MMSPEVQRILGKCQDQQALVDVEMAQRVINHYIAENFVTNFCQDEKGMFGFCYDPQCFEDRAKRAGDGD